MSSDLSISVLLPVYMREPNVTQIQLLKRALESILDQKTEIDREILLVDDGSAVPVSEFSSVLGSISDCVRWIRISTNRGLVNALNTGIVAAKHALIARLDADDVWLPTKINKQIALFAQDGDLSIAATGMSMMDMSGAIIENHIRPGDWRGILRFFVEIGCPFPHGSVVARKDIYRLLGGYSHNASFSHCEDYALWGTWLRFFKPAMIEEALYGYTVSETSVSAIHREQQLDASQVVRLKFAEGMLTDRLPEALSSLASHLDISLMEAGKLAYWIWNFKPNITLPRAVVQFLSVILFDREFSVLSGTGAGVHWTALLGLPHRQSGHEISGHFYAI